MKYTIVYTKENIGYSVQVLELPGCISEGDTQIDAEINIKEAILLYLESMKEIIKMKKMKEEVFLDSVIVDYETI